MNEEILYKNWMLNVLNKLAITIDNLDIFEECSKGILILKIIEYFFPGSVDNSLIEHNVNNRFKKISNCNLIIKTLNSVNIKIEGISSVDVVDKNKERCYGILWQLIKVNYNKEINDDDKLLDETDDNIKNWVNSLPVNCTNENLFLEADEEDDLITADDRADFFNEYINYNNIPTLNSIVENNNIKFNALKLSMLNNKIILQSNASNNDNNIKILNYVINNNIIDNLREDTNDMLNTINYVNVNVKNITAIDINCNKIIIKYNNLFFKHTKKDNFPLISTDLESDIIKYNLKPKLYKIIKFPNINNKIKTLSLKINFNYINIRANNFTNNNIKKEIKIKNYCPYKCNTITIRQKNNIINIKDNILPFYFLLNNKLLNNNIKHKLHIYTIKYLTNENILYTKKVKHNDGDDNDIIITNESINSKIIKLNILKKNNNVNKIIERRIKLLTYNNTVDKTRKEISFFNTKKERQLNYINIINYLKQNEITYLKNIYLEIFARSLSYSRNVNSNLRDLVEQYLNKYSNIKVKDYIKIIFSNK